MLRLVEPSDKFQRMEALADRIRSVIAESRISSCDVSTVLHLFASESDAQAVESQPDEVEGPNDDGANLETRLARMLAKVIDAPLMTVRDTLNDRPMELHVGSFLPDLGNSAAELLEEAGF
jgi:hypothetical protein